MTSPSAAAASASTVGQRARERLEIGLHRGDRGLLQHHLATARRDRGRAAAPASARHGRRRLSTAYQHKSASEASTGMGRLCHASRQGWNWRDEIGARPGRSGRRSRRARSARAPFRTCCPLAGGAAFRRFGFVQSSIVSRWQEIVGARYAAVSSPESIRFPLGKKSRGVLTLVVEGAHAPMMQHVAPAIVERVNAFFGYPAVARVAFRQGIVQAAQSQSRGRRRLRCAADPGRAGRIRCARSPIRSCAPAWNCLRAASPTAKERRW